MPNRAEDWLRQADRNPEQAEASRRDQRHEWACFAAQQAAEIVEKAKVIDNFYIPTRYPNGHPEGAPYHHYGSIQSGEAIRYAGEIIELVRDQMAGR